ncbi:MAG: hypothetical protein ACI8UD_001266 [Planctomycetota bacterium]
MLLPHRGVEQTAALLRRSPDSVQRKALDLLRVTPRKGDWTDSDDWQLRQAWGAVELRLLAPMLGRPANEVRLRAAELRSRLKSGSWTREEMRLLKKLYGTRADEDLEVSLMRSRSEIARAAQRMCLAKDKKFQSACNNAIATKTPSAGKSGKSKPVVRSRMPRWTSAEVEMLRQIYPEHDNLVVARALARSVTSVANKAFQLGIHKSAALLTSIGRSNIAHRYHTEEEEVAAAALAATDSAPVGPTPAVEPTVMLPAPAKPEPARSQVRPASPELAPIDAGDVRVAQEGAGDDLMPTGD